MIKAPRSIETDRLRLDAPDLSDATEIFQRYASDAEVTRYLGWPRHRSVADTEGFLAFSALVWQQTPAGPYLIRSRTDGRVLGSTGIMFEAEGRVMAGYVLAKDAWGRGYATEALLAMMDVSGMIGVTELRALCHPDHRASWHVLEKCGFTRDTTWTGTAEFPNLAPGVQQTVFCYVWRPDSR